MSKPATILPYATPTPSRREAEIGLAYGVAAYAWWGLIPIYFKWVAHLAPLSVLAHRVIWSFVFLGILVAARRRWDEVRDVLARPRTLLLLAGSTIGLAGNWGTFIYAVSNNLVLQASLGYFVVPLVSVFLAVVVLKERLRRWQVIGLTLAAVGVGVLTYARGTLPWIALVIAFSWSSYALLRKIAHVGPTVGVAVETAMLVPVAALYLLVTPPASARGMDGKDYALLVLAGVVTALPLLWFTAAAKRLRLTTLGFLQYGAPIGQFLLAVMVYDEEFGTWNFVGFAFIWAALIVYTIDSLRAYRAATAPPADQDAGELPAIAEI